VWLLGFLLYLLISGLPQLGLSGWAPWLGATLPSFLFGVIVYVLVSRSVVKQVQD
jgi:lipopolysaccharide export LptBFGC system permease protein LptF